MNTRDQVNHYLTLLESRLRWQVILKGAAIALGVALGATLALVLITNALAFSSTSLVFARIVLFISLAVALGMALVLPLLALNRRRTAGRAEQAFPQFQERLVTYVERSEPERSHAGAAGRGHGSHDAARDSGNDYSEEEDIWFCNRGGRGGRGVDLADHGWSGIPRLWSIAALGGCAQRRLGKLLRHYGRPGQQAGAPQVGSERHRAVGRLSVARVRLMARYKSSSKWEEARMLPRANGSAYEFLFAGLPEPVDYYVEAAGVKSKTYTLDVVDLPGIKKIKVTYHYPSWLGQADTVEDPGGDLRAVVGTTAELTVETDRPLKNGVIEMDDGSHIKLDPLQGNMLTAKVPIQKDGLYHFAGMEQGQSFG